MLQSHQYNQNGACSLQLNTVVVGFERTIIVAGNRGLSHVAKPYLYNALLNSIYTKHVAKKKVCGITGGYRVIHYRIKILPTISLIFLEVTAMEFSPTR